MSNKPFEINTFLRGKESKLDTNKCMVQKVIRLSGSEYDDFISDFFAYRDFIEENVGHMGYDAQGREYCLLVIGEGRQDGVLVNSSGYGYARYTAPVPYATDIVNLRHEPVYGRDGFLVTDPLEKPSVLAQLREAKANAAHSPEPKQPTKSKHKNNINR